MKAYLSFLYEMEDSEWCPEKLGWPTGGGYSLSPGQRPTLVARASIMPVVEESWAPQEPGLPLAVWGHLKSHLAWLAGILPLSLQTTLGKEAPWGGKTHPRSLGWMEAESAPESGPWLPVGVYPLFVSVSPRLLQPQLNQRQVNSSLPGPSWRWWGMGCLGAGQFSVMPSDECTPEALPHALLSVRA